MKISKTSQLLAISAIAAAAIVFGIHRIASSREAPPPAAAKRVPGVVILPDGTPQLSALRIRVAEEFPLPVSAPVNARVAYDENVTARVSSAVAGRIVGIGAEIGDTVRHGSVLVRLDSPDLASAEADWRKAEADEKRKRLAAERARDLFAHEVLARKDLESAEADFQQAAAETRRAAQRMKNLHATGSENGVFPLRSPIDGIVADRQVNPGLEVRPDLPNPLFVITDLRRLWAIADVPEHSAVDIKPGQPISLESDAYPGTRFEGRVERVGVALDPGTRRVQIRCAVTNPDGKLKPEMFVRLNFADDTSRKAVRLENTALFVEGLHTYAFVETERGRFEKRQVVVALRDTSQSYLTNGIKPGEKIVAEGALLLNAEADADAQ